MKIDLSEKLTLTRWNLIQITLISVAIGAATTLLEAIIGFVIIGLTILVFAAPLFIKIFGGTKNDEIDA